MLLIVSVKCLIFLLNLIHFGAVHCALVCPKPPPTASAEQIQLFKEVTASTVLKKRSSLKGKTVREAQKTFRITSPSEYIEAGSYLRVHVHPKRFPRCYEVDWSSRVIAETGSYVVLDKPAGTSVGGTTDNIEETCATFTTRAMGLSSPLKTTHQIDNCTEGWQFHYLSSKPNIRAQLAACGAPIIGDSIYMPAAIKMMTAPYLYPFAEAETINEVRNDEAMNATIDQWILQHGKEPDLAIGLQACEISWNDGECTYQAGPPWWRSD